VELYKANKDPALLPQAQAIASAGSPNSPPMGFWLIRRFPAATRRSSKASSYATGGSV